MNSDFNCLSIGYSQFIRRNLQSSWYKQVPTHCLSLFATSAEDLPDSVIFSFTMNYTKTTWFLQSTFINILHINPRMASIRFHLTELNLPHCIYHTELEEFRRKHLTLLFSIINNVILLLIIEFLFYPPSPLTFHHNSDNIKMF